MHLLENPFWILGATQWDDRATIIRLASGRQLEGCGGPCAQAEAVLLNPRQRLAAEVAWLPGMEREEVVSLVGALRGNRPAGRRTERADSRQRGSDEPALVAPPSATIVRLPALPRANVLATLLCRRRGRAGREEVLNRAAYLMRTWDRVDAEEVFSAVNRARSAAGIVGVSRPELVAKALAERRRWYRSTILEVLASREVGDITEALTILAERLTNVGTRKSPILLADVVEGYEVRVRTRLQEGEQAIHLACDRLQRLLNDRRAKRSDLESEVRQLEDLLREWDRLAQPVQVTMKAEGRSHRASENLSHRVRGISVDLWNRRRDARLARRLNRILRNVFAEVDAVVDQLEEDADVLEELAERGKGAAVLERAAVEAKAAIQLVEAGPHRGMEVTLELERRLGELLREAGEELDPEARRQVEDLLAASFRAIAVIVGNETGAWRKCRLILQKARRLVHDRELAERIERDLRTVRSNEWQGGVAGLLGTILGIVVAIGGRILVVIIFVVVMRLLAAACR